MTALSIAQRLGYISVVEELKVVTETTIASKHELITEERYKVYKSCSYSSYIYFFILLQIQAPEVSHEEHPLTDSDDETGKDKAKIIFKKSKHHQIL
jgi:predicted metalloprotease with PDZ domain